MNLENVVVEGSGLTTKTDGIRRLKTWSKLVQFYLGSEIYHFIPARDETNILLLTRVQGIWAVERDKFAQAVTAAVLSTVVVANKDVPYP